MAKITCSFCNTLNDATEKTCIGCGAPLEAPTPLSAVQPVVAQQAFPPVSPVSEVAKTGSSFDSASAQKLQDGAQQVDRLYKSAMSAYQTAWSVTGDAIAIALAAFAIGVVGGATGMGFWGVLGAMLVGVFLGFTEQPFWVNVIASPAGTLIGIIGWGVLWALGFGPKGMVFMATALACLGALLGARRRTAPLGCSAAVRPLLGAVGGFFFALFGLVIGLGIRAIL